jgi:four helix bundle protein
MKNTLETLEVYQISKSISKQAWIIFKKLPKPHQFGIGMQMLRAADSISANIAEGYGRYHYKESVNFNNYARGSAYETLDWISKLQERCLTESEESKQITLNLNLFIRKLNGYNKYLRSKINSN